jgi:hypothetical protein
MAEKVHRDMTKLVLLSILRASGKREARDSAPESSDSEEAVDTTARSCARKAF